jgi:hypothetical protein
MSSVHTVIEGVTSGRRRPAHLLATNVYVKTPRGWRIVLHHASIAPGGAPADARERRSCTDACDDLYRPILAARRPPQTIYPALCIGKPAVAFRRERWQAPDGDFVDVDLVDGQPGQPFVVLFHGLEGSSTAITRAP